MEVVIIEKCNRCKAKINKEVNRNQVMYVCPKCNMWVANIYYGKNKKSNTETNQKT